MKTSKCFLFLLLSIAGFSAVFSQSTNLNLDIYKQFIAQHKDMSASQLLNMYPITPFRKTVNSGWASALYHDSVAAKYNLTAYEKSLIQQHGFVVTERLKENSFGRQFSNIYHKDLPVFISTDAILHPLHVSYDRILKNIEVGFIIPKLQEFLSNLSANMTVLNSKYSANTEMLVMLKDVDVYLSVAKALLTGNTTTYYPENVSKVDSLIIKINKYKVDSDNLFSNGPRTIDFSQFKPRAHYTDETYPELAKYFKTMMWLGRIELNLLSPDTLNESFNQTIKRQTIDASLISELIDVSGSYNLYMQIESIIKVFVGEQDNVTIDNLREVLADINITNSGELLDTLNLKKFQNDLAEKAFADQKILSHILFNNPAQPDSVKPISSFLLFGQRFVIDSYITGDVVYDRIKYNGGSIKRMLPNALDMLFPLGNSASAQLLQDDLNKYHYATNLAGLRYLVDSFDSTFWQSSIYSAWLNTIRTLNPPGDRTTLPEFMQTAAWWQEKMNTQLASWSQLRHDNLLYAKQSYSASVICSFPYGYVEPIPDFYKKVSLLADSVINKINKIDFDKKNGILSYLNVLKGAADTLGNIAGKELRNVPFSDSEISFLKRLIYNNPDHMCGTPEYLGWYPKLFYNSNNLEDGFYNQNFVVADYHTAPTDENGIPVGWVKHAGTGPVDLAIVVAKLPGGQSVAFTGPVMSFHEITTTNFQRLTDEEWKQTYLNRSTRPDWVNVYLADSTGNSRGEGLMLLTGINDELNKEKIPADYIIAQNYPNPFNPGTTISFTVPENLDGRKTSLTVYDINGRVVKKLIDRILPSGSYLTRWNGTNEFGKKVSSGIYFYKVQIGIQKFIGKMNLIK